MKTQTIFGTLAVLVPIGLALPQTTGTASFSADSIIERDVVIVGGGSSGAHAAVQIKDAGKKVIVIEKAGELGGHVKTYTAKSGVRVNYGPSNFQNYKAVQDFFGRFNIPLTKYVQPGSSDIYADFSTGKAVPNGTLPTPDFTAYLAQVNKVCLIPNCFNAIRTLIKTNSTPGLASLGLSRSRFLKIYFCLSASLSRSTVCKMSPTASPSSPLETATFLISQQSTS
jgi:hypothetical protein